VTGSWITPLQTNVRQQHAWDVSRMTDPGPFPHVTAEKHVGVKIFTMAAKSRALLIQVPQGGKSIAVAWNDVGSLIRLGHRQLGLSLKGDVVLPPGASDYAFVSRG